VARSTVIALLLLLAGCTAEPPPHEDPDIEGVITAVRPLEDGVQLRVEAEPGPLDETGGDKWELRVPERTPVFLEMEDGSLRRAPVLVLQEGQRAHAWHTGTVMESFPMQAEARAILLVEPAP
jgi:hypothetical protein